MKRYGIIVMDKNTGKRISGVKVELTDFKTATETGVIFDSGVTDKFGLVYVDPEERRRTDDHKWKRIKEMTN